MSQIRNKLHQQAYSKKRLGALAKTLRATDQELVFRAKISTTRPLLMRRVLRIQWRRLLADARQTSEFRSHRGDSEQSPFRRREERGEHNERETQREPTEEVA
jgi:hypothetical protein